MAYAAGTVRVVISGTMPQGERFAFGYQLQGTNGAAGVRATAAVSAAQAGLTGANGTPLLNLMVSSQKIDTISAYVYDGGQNAAASDTITVNFPGNAAPNTWLPNQVALVASLRTAGAGPSARGRMYLPLLGALATSGQATAAQCTAVAGFVKQLISQYASSTGDGQPLVPVVASAKRGVNRPVTSIYVDSRFDTIRARAEKTAVFSNAVVTLP